VEKDYSLLENKLLVAEARVQDLQRLLEPATTTTEVVLVQEKADLMALNLGLSERIRYCIAAIFHRAVHHFINQL
jgi:hypothetical protein